MEIDEPPTKKICECGAKETGPGLILVIVASCLIFPINMCKFALHEPQAAQAQCVSFIINTCSFILRNFEWP